jgi:hypothetical protein
MGIPGEAGSIPKKRESRGLQSSRLLDLIPLAVAIRFLAILNN